MTVCTAEECGHPSQSLHQSYPTKYAASTGHLISIIGAWAFWIRTQMQIAGADQLMMSIDMIAQRSVRGMYGTRRQVHIMVLLEAGGADPEEPILLPLYLPHTIIQNTRSSLVEPLLRAPQAIRPSSEVLSSNDSTHTGPDGSFMVCVRNLLHGSWLPRRVPILTLAKIQNLKATSQRHKPQGLTTTRCFRGAKEAALKIWIIHSKVYKLDTYIN